MQVVIKNGEVVEIKKDINEICSLKSGRRLKNIDTSKDQRHWTVFDENGELVENDIVQFINKKGKINLRCKIEKGILDMGWHNVLPSFQKKLEQGEEIKQESSKTMGHFIFIILHTVCVLFGFVGLIVTIPLHIIYAAVKK